VFCHLDYYFSKFFEKNSKFFEKSSKFFEKSSKFFEKNSTTYYLKLLNFGITSLFSYLILINLHKNSKRTKWKKT
jgi:hypothetical protein